MTNIFNHHLHRITLLQQAHHVPAQKTPLAMRAEAGRRVEAPSSAFPRALPRDAACGIPREPARQDASRTPQSTQAYSTPPASSQQGGISLLHNAQVAPPIESANAGGSEPRLDRQRPRGGVRQDKARVESARVSLPQPAPVTKVTRARLSNTSRVRSSAIRGREKRERVTLWVDPLAKAELERLAVQEGLSISAAGAAFLDKALQRNIDLEYSALLQPIIEQAIARQMRGISTRLAWLLVRVAFDAGQTRCLVTNILGRQPGVSDAILKTILEGGARTSKANIMRRTPQIESLVEAVEQWITGEEEETNKNDNK